MKPLKTTIFLIILLPICLFGDVVKGGGFDAKYERATKLYKSKNYKKAYEIFSKIYLSKLSDAKLSFYLGHSAYETGHYEIALAAFERVEILEPTNLRNKLEKARTYFMLKMYEEAENSFEEVLNSPMIPKNVRNNIELYIAKVRAAQKKSFSYATLNINWLYDSNVNYGSLDDSYNIGSIEYPTADERADRAFEVSLDLVNIYDFGDANGFALKNRAFGYLKDYKKEDDYDIAYFSYMPSLLYKERRYSAEIVVGFETMNLASKNYLRSIYYMPKLEYLHTNSLRSILYFKYQTKSFRQAKHSDLNSNHYELSYGVQSILTPRSYLQANIVAIKEKKRQGSRIDVDYDEYRLNAIYANHFTSIYSAELYGEIKKRKYEDFSSLFDSTRDDVGKSVSLSLGAKILQTLSLNAKLSYSRVDSNQNLFSYQKHTISLGLTKIF